MCFPSSEISDASDSSITKPELFAQGPESGPWIMTEVIDPSLTPLQSHWPRVCFPKSSPSLPLNPSLSPFCRAQAPVTTYHLQRAPCLGASSSWSWLFR